MNPNPNAYCVIMAGGIGSRFWPLSKNRMPKQFLDVLGTGKSFIRCTFERFLPLVPVENFLVVTSELYRDLVREHLPELAPEQILTEPVRRSTAPCVAYATYRIAARNPEATMIVAPSDHIITGEAEFQEIVREGIDFVSGTDNLMTIGIRPSRPETGYGYIQIDTAPHDETAGTEVRKVKTFTEKPNIEMARVFVESGEFFWNSGIFLWSVKSILEALHNYAPDLTSTFDNGLATFGTPEENAFIQREFPGCVNISIDYAVMERASNVYVECVNFGWSDLGTWSALYDNSPKNRDSNVVQNCQVLAYNSSGNIFAVPGDKLVVVNGLHDYIVADAGDVLLVCPKSEEQHIKQYVNDVKLSYKDKYL